MNRATWDLNTLLEAEVDSAQNKLLLRSSHWIFLHTKPVFARLALVLTLASLCCSELFDVGSRGRGAYAWYRPLRPVLLAACLVSSDIQ